MAHHHYLGATHIAHRTHLAVKYRADSGAWSALEVDTLIVECHVLQSFHIIASKVAHHLACSSQGHGQSSTVALKRTIECTVFAGHGCGFRRLFLGLVELGLVAFCLHPGLAFCSYSVRLSLTGFSLGTLSLSRTLGLGSLGLSLQSGFPLAGSSYSSFVLAGCRLSSRLFPGQFFCSLLCGGLLLRHAPWPWPPPQPPDGQSVH